MLQLLNPSNKPAKRPGPLAKRLDTLDGKRIGIIWNRRLHGDKIFSMVLEVLRQKYAIKEVIFREKPYLGNSAPQEIFSEFVEKQVDAAFAGVGD